MRTLYQLVSIFNGGILQFNALQELLVRVGKLMRS